MVTFAVIPRLVQRLDHAVLDGDHLLAVLDDAHVGVGGAFDLSDVRCQFGQLVQGMLPKVRYSAATG